MDQARWRRADRHKQELDTLDKNARFRRLCELNVVEQVFNVSRTRILRAAWTRQQKVSVHGWIYAIENGLLRDLGIMITGPRQAQWALVDGQWSLNIANSSIARITADMTTDRQIPAYHE